MNFLQLSQRLRLEAAIDGSGPTTVVGNTNNEYARVVNWINAAYLDIQSKNDDWNFMWAEFTKTLSASTGEYTALEMTHDTPASRVEVSRFNNQSFRYYLASTGVSGENFCCYHPWSFFRDMYQFGSTRTQEGVPSEFSIKPNRNVVFWQIPNDSYVIRGEFYRAATSMSVDADEPIFADEFHLAIVWWAMMNYAGFEETSFQYQHAKNQLDKIMNKMERQERPEIEEAGPLV